MGAPSDAAGLVVLADRWLVDISPQFVLPARITSLPLTSPVRHRRVEVSRASDQQKKKEETALCVPLLIKLSKTVPSDGSLSSIFQSECYIWVQFSNKYVLLSYSTGFFGLVKVWKQLCGSISSGLQMSESGQITR